MATKTTKKKPAKKPVAVKPGEDYASHRLEDAIDEVLEEFGYGSDASIVEVWASLERLKAKGSISESGGKFKFVDESPAATNGAGDESGKAATLRSVESILAAGSKSAKDIGSLLGVTTDAAGAMLRRRIKKGTIQRAVVSGATEQHFELVATENGAAKPAAEDPKIDGELDGNENDDDPSGQWESSNGGGTATATDKRNRVKPNPLRTKPLFGGSKPR